MNAEEARKVLKGIRVDNDDEFHAIKIAREALAQRKTTKWVDDGYYMDGRHAYHCAECGWKMISFERELFKFCPNCGKESEE